MLFVFVQEKAKSHMGWLCFQDLFLMKKAPFSFGSLSLELALVNSYIWWMQQAAAHSLAGGSLPPGHEVGSRAQARVVRGPASGLSCSMLVAPNLPLQPPTA